MNNKRASDIHIDTEKAGMAGLPFESVNDALTAMVDLLNTFVPFQLWMVTRVAGDSWTVIHAKDAGYEVKTGAVFRWSDSYCSRLVRGEGPNYAEDAKCVAAYQTAPINKALKIGAYVGQPLMRDNGSLIGTLCAVNPEKVEPLTSEQKLLIETLTRSMSTLLSVYLQAEEARQQAALSQLAAETDPLTKIGNRRAWDGALESEETALLALAENAMVLVIDLDGLKETNDTLGHAAGDAMLRKTAKVLRKLFRGSDTVCRLGGDEFGVLVRGVSNTTAAEIKNRVAEALQAAYIPASVGYAMRLEHTALHEAAKAADAAMYANKQTRKEACV